MCCCDHLHFLTQLPATLHITSLFVHTSSQRYYAGRPQSKAPCYLFGFLPRVRMTALGQSRIPKRFSLSLSP